MVWPILVPMNGGKLFASHESVGHTYGEYVRGDAHTNSVEGFFSILKRGLITSPDRPAPDLSTAHSLA